MSEIYDEIEVVQICDECYQEELKGMEFEAVIDPPPERCLICDTDKEGEIPVKYHCDISFVSSSLGNIVSGLPHRDYFKINSVMGRAEE